MSRRKYDAKFELCYTEENICLFTSILKTLQEVSKGKVKSPAITITFEMSGGVRGEWYSTTPAVELVRSSSEIDAWVRTQLNSIKNHMTHFKLVHPHIRECIVPASIVVNLNFRVAKPWSQDFRTYTGLQ